MFVDREQMTAFIERYGKAGPRYTSYPTALHFVPGFDRSRVVEELRQVVVPHKNARSTALYVHVPFCERRCLFCGCHTLIRRDRGIGTRYVDGLIAELQLWRDACEGELNIEEVHFGGGTPTWLAPKDMARLVAAIRTICNVKTAGEWAIEVDPETVDRAAIVELVELGFSRFSFGVQDLDAKVSDAIGRKNRNLHVALLTEQLRVLGVSQVNYDLIYGLPYQDLRSIEWTIEQVISMRPSRIALYGYAHVPWIKKHQRGLEKHGLPDPTERMDLQLHARELLIARGYVSLGMDHFALPADPLARAFREGRMKRTFMGYTSGGADDVIAIGASAIANFGDAFSQNQKDLTHWRADIDAGRLPWCKGLVRDDDDRMRSHIIERVMCDLALDKDALQAEFDEAWLVCLREARGALQALEDDELIEQSATHINVTPRGTVFLRNIAMAFDGRLAKQPPAVGPQHSATV